MKQDLSKEIKEVLYGYVEAASLVTLKKKKLPKSIFLTTFQNRNTFKKILNYTVPILSKETLMAEQQYGQC